MLYNALSEKIPRFVSHSLSAILAPNTDRFNLSAGGIHWEHIENKSEELRNID